MKRKMIIKSLYGFVNRAAQDHVGAYAAQAAYFLILSFIPFLLFLATLVRYTPLTYQLIKDAISSVIPTNVQGFVLGVVSEVYGKSTAIVPITAVTLIWSAGKGMQSLSNGLNSIYHVKETRNWLMNRIWAMFYTVLMGLALAGTLILQVFGNSIYRLLCQYMPFAAKMLSWLVGAKSFLVFVVLLLVFLVLYKVLPNRKTTLKSQFPGALFTTAAWLTFSYLFSLYFDFFPSFSNMYGSLAALILVMLWMYICMNIVLYGAEINAYFEKEIQKAEYFARELFDKERTEKEESRS